MDGGKVKLGMLVRLPGAFDRIQMSGLFFLLAQINPGCAAAKWQWAVLTWLGTAIFRAVK
jgi:hypothetical protein